MFFETGTGPAPVVKYLFLGEAPPAYPAARIATGASQSSRPSNRFYGWKVDLIAPFRRTSLGFDVVDEVLDIVVRRDRSYLWKDEDEMARFVELGIYSQAEDDVLHEAGREVIDLVNQSRSPFDDEWIGWKPPSKLRFVPEAPADWQYLPLAKSEWGDLHRRVNVNHTQP